MTSREVRQVYDEIADEYDAAYEDGVALAENAVLASELRRLGVHAGEGPVIDVGCGTGLLLELLGPMPDRYVGIDISPRMLDKARVKFPEHRFLEHDIANGTWPAAEADAVVSLFGGFTYATPRRRAVEHMADSLRPGGRVFLVLSMRPSSGKVLVEHHLDAPQHADTAESAHTLLGGRCWRNVKVRGFSMLRLPSARWMAFEYATLGRLLPSRAHYIIVTGERN